MSFLELHDSEIASAERTGSRAAVELRHAPVFVQKGPTELYDLWSWVGGVRFDKVVKWHCVGESSGTISEVVGIGNLVELREESNGKAGRTLEVSSVRILLTNGSVIEVECSSVSFELLSRGELIEEWEGPLWSEDAKGNVELLPPQ